MKTGRNIFIINQYAANKGDRAVLYALVRLVSGLNPRKIVVSSHDPLLWEGFEPVNGNEVTFVPWGWDYITSVDGNLVTKGWFRFLERVRKYTYTLVREMFLAGIRIPAIYSLFANPRFFAALRRSDVAISTGGHHITTLLSRDAISEQIFDMAVTLGSRKKLVLWSQSVGPLVFFNPRNEKFIRKILLEAHRIFIRDEQSKELLTERDIVRRIDFAYETVISLNQVIGTWVPPSERENILGISIYSTTQRSPEELEKYISVMAEASGHAVAKGIKVQFFPMEVKGSTPDDRWLIQMIRERCGNPGMIGMEDEDLPTPEHLRRVGACRYFIGHKTHSIIFALTAGTPLVAIAYHAKSSDFMQQYGVPQFCIDEDELSGERVIRSFDLLMDNLDITGNQLFSRSRDFSASIIQSIRSVMEA
jgi:polysaccharide pyruvyl transferase WcaK-like protein